ncbi:MarR family transcriptional regulator [Burkholderia sp. Ac-20353]|nr:MarR family transcriptional regulator [Burkholderia sp. Ac-20353]
MSDVLLQTGSGSVPREADGFRMMLGVQLSINRVLNQRMLTTLEIPLSQGSALVHLARGGTMSCQELARLLGCGTSRLSRLACELERRALVVRRRSSQDRRTLDLSLTPAGLALAERVPSVLAESERVILSRLSEEERGFLKRFLHRLLGALSV